MNPDANAEAITLTDDEKDSILNADSRSHMLKRIESILATRLAGAGAQVTEAAVEAAAESLLNPPTVRINASEAEWFARAALSAALPHMGTGQSEADLRARISALADEMEQRSQDEEREYPLRTVWADCATALRALLDRPATEGDNE